LLKNAAGSEKEVAMNIGAQFHSRVACLCRCIAVYASRGFLRGQRPHANDCIFHDTELSLPVGSRFQRRHDSGRDCRWRRHRDPKEHNATGRSSATPKNQFPKILVEGQQEAHRKRAVENFIVSGAWNCLTNPEDIVPAFAQRGDAVPWNILIGTKAHRAISQRLGRHGKNLFLAQPVPGVSQTRTDLLYSEVWIIAENFCLTPTLRHEINNELNCESSAADDWLASQHGWIRGDVLLPFHVEKLAMALISSKRFPAT
jgi:hypothetical protein